MFWQGTLSLYEQVCMLSFVKQGFQVELYSYQELDVPEGVLLKDAQSILDQSLLTKYTQGGKKASPTAFANLFRYKLLSLQGGFWADADIICLRPVSDFVDLQAQARGKILFVREDLEKVNNAIIISEQGHPLLQKMFETAHDHDPIVKVWGSLGPILVTDFAERFPEQIEVLPIPTFYPIHYKDFFQVMLPNQYQTCQEKTRQSYGLHLWNAMIKRCYIPQNVLPPKGSFLHHLFKEFFPADYPCLPETTLLQLLEGSRAMAKLNKIKDLIM